MLQVCQHINYIYVQGHCILCWGKKQYSRFSIQGIKMRFASSLYRKFRGIECRKLCGFFSVKREMAVETGWKQNLHCRFCREECRIHRTVESKCNADLVFTSFSWFLRLRFSWEVHIPTSKKDSHWIFLRSPDVIGKNGSVPHTVCTNLDKKK